MPKINQSLKCNCRRESGIAMLFAVGMLALLLTVGLAMVSGGLIAKHSASNISCASMSENIAGSVAESIRGEIQYLHKHNSIVGDDSEDSGGDSARILGSNFFTDLPVSLGDDTAERICADEQFARYGELCDDNDVNYGYLPRWRYPRQTLTSYTYPADTALDWKDVPFDETDGFDWSLEQNRHRQNKPQWIYMFSDSSAVSGRRIIARYAYRVLPPVSDSRINLYRFISGDPADGSGSVDESELDCVAPDSIIISSAAENNSMSSIGNRVLNGISVRDYLVAADKDWGKDDTGDADWKQYNRNWFSANFDGSAYRGDVEAFHKHGEDDSKLYARFDLNRDDITVASLIGNDASGTAAKYDLVVYPDNNYLEFLRYIGMSSWLGFSGGGYKSDDAHTRQIAANIQDYCDADDTPSSDVSPAEWSNRISGSQPSPQYTGNERTPYLNGISFLIGIDKDSVKTGDRITFSPHIWLGVEIVDIYGTGDADKYNVKLHFNDDVNLPVHIWAKGSYKHSDGSTVFVNTMQELVAESGEVKIPDGDIEITQIDLLSGYGTGCEEIACNDCMLKFKDMNSGDGSISVSEIKIVMSGDGNWLENKFGGMVLVNSADTAKNGLDYADLSELKMKFSSGDLIVFDGDMNDLPDVPVHAACTGIYALDPRTNLCSRHWVSLSDDGKLEDGSIIKFYADTALETSGTSETVQQFCRKAFGNSKSCYGPKYAYDNITGEGGGHLADAEIVSEFAWKGNDRNQHLSTAYIRNGKMESLWELGAVSRGTPFQTINLTNADLDWSWGNPVEYNGGDGLILDQTALYRHDKDGVAMVRSYGKIDLNMLWERNDRDDERKWRLPGAYFLDKLGMDFENGEWPMVSDAGTVSGVLGGGDGMEPVRYAFYNISVRDAENAGYGDFIIGGNFPLMKLDFDWDTEVPPGSRAGLFFMKGDEGNLLFDMSKDNSECTDAELEEFWGRIANDVKAGEPSLLTSFRALIVVQTIADVADGVKGSVRYHGENFSSDDDLKAGRLDFKKITDPYSNKDKYIYFDDITSTTLALAEFDRNPVDGEVVLRSLRYLPVAQDNVYNLIDYDTLQ